MPEQEENPIAKKILDDLVCRKMKIVAMICETEDGSMQLLSYDEHGLVRFISDPVKEFSINERLGERRIRPVADISQRKAKDIAPQAQRQDSTKDQLRDIFEVANRMGCYAADCIKRYLKDNAKL